MAYDYFAGFPIAGETREFLVTFAGETDLDALARALSEIAPFTIGGGSHL